MSRLILLLVFFPFPVFASNYDGLGWVFFWFLFFCFSVLYFLFSSIPKSESIVSKGVIDINNHTIGEFTLGQYINNNSLQLNISGDGTIQCDGYCANVSNNKIISVQILFSSFFSTGDVFKGRLRRNSAMLTCTEYLSPNSIKSWFGEPIDQFDDGVEFNCKFKDGDVLIEFSWHHRDDRLVANYISFEIS